MLLNCGAGEDSWESLGLQGDPTSPFWRRSVLNIYWKDWCWSSNTNTLATCCEELTPRKRLKAKGEEGGRGWDSWMASPTQWTWNTRSSAGEGSLGCCSPRIAKSLTWLSDWTTATNQGVALAKKGKNKFDSNQASNYNWSRGNTKIDKNVKYSRRKQSVKPRICKVLQEKWPSFFNKCKKKM